MRGARLRSAVAGAVALAVVLALPAGALGQDSAAPPGAGKQWLPSERWVDLLWLPYDEARLYRALGHDRGDVFRWVRDEKTLAQLGARAGKSVDALADELVGPRRAALGERRYAVVRARAKRTLTQGHLGQHLLFHGLHQVAIPDRATQIFGTRTKEQFLKLRRAEVSPLEIGELNGRTRVDMTRDAIGALRDAAQEGVREGTLTRAQAALMLDRQLRQVPRWLGQNRYNGPSGGRNRPQPVGDFAKHPSLSADGRTVVWDAYRATISEAERLGEIHVRGADLESGETFGVSPGRSSPRRPRSAYNCVLSADGHTVAFESSESTYPLAKRVGQMTVMVRDLETGKVDKVSHAYRRPGAPTRTAFNPTLSADGRMVAFEATDAGRDRSPSRNGLWVVDRKRGTQRLVADGSVGAAYLPEMSADGRALAFTSAAPGADGFTRVYLRTIGVRGGGRTELVSRGDGPAGAPASSDAAEPALSRDGRIVAFTSRAANLTAGGNGRRSRIYVRDRATGRTEVVSGGVRGRDVSAPSLSRNGRFVAFLAREGKPDGTLAGLRTNLWLHDRRTKKTKLVSRADGLDGKAAHGYYSEPSVSDDGRRVVFTSTSGALVAGSGKPAGLPGVFARDTVWGTTRLLSTHRARRGAADRLAVASVPPLGRLRRIDTELKLGLGVGGMLALAGLAAAVSRMRRARGRRAELSVS